jgi:hypothetical protein
MAILYNVNAITDGLTFCYDEGNPKSGTTKDLVSGATNAGIFTSEIRFAPNSLTDTMWSTAAGKDFYAPAAGTGFTISLWTKRTAATTGTWDEVCLLEYDYRCMWFGYFQNQTAQFHCSFPYYDSSNVFNYWSVDPTFANAGITHAIGTWYNICITYNNSTRLLSTYMNSSFAASGTRPGLGDLVKPYLGTNAAIRIWGTQGNSSTENHLTNNVRMYNRSLSVEEITENFNALKGRYGY